MRVRSGIAIAAALGLVVACFSVGTTSSDHPELEEPYLGPRSPCSTGEAYAIGTPFPPGPRESPHPECIQRCGEHPVRTWGTLGGPSPGIEAVPSGTCDYEGEACSMVAVEACCEPTATHGTASLFECRCHSGAWSCVAALVAGGMCRACEDAGTTEPDPADAATEDAAITDAATTDAPADDAAITDAAITDAPADG